jgi:hypothetical protein
MELESGVQKVWQLGHGLVAQWDLVLEHWSAQDALVHGKVFEWGRMVRTMAESLKAAKVQNLIASLWARLLVALIMLGHEYPL